MSPFLLRENICVKVYDVETKQIIAVYQNYKKASTRLGIPSPRIHRCALNRSRMYSPMLNKLIAIRVGQCDKEMQDLIEKTLKNKI